MKANELRIGNWVNTFETESKIVPERITEIICTDEIHLVNNCRLEFYLPILLTPEILEKAGFTKQYDKFVIKDSDGHDLEFEGIDEDGILQPYPYYTGANISEKAKPKYLHQLQNLYFALTGEELSIDLCPQ
jgi:hypothetical protein